MKKELTIVTAFFDIGREKFKNFERDNNKYIEYFKFWARIQNNVVIFTQPEFKDEIMGIRKKFGLDKKTKIITIKNINQILPDIYNKMVNIENSKYFKSYKYNDDTPENRADYNYVMFLKSWCMMETAKKGYNKTDYLVWLDFGFNHGGEVYSNPEDFDFLWEYDFENKIYFFTPYGESNNPIFYIIQSGEVCVSGTPFIVPVKLINEYWSLVLGAVNKLLDIGLMDDDQTILLMAYREKPELFNLIKCDWFLPVKKYGGEHLSLQPPKEQKKLNLFDKMLYYYRVKKRNYRFIRRIRKVFLKDYLD